VPGLGLLPVVTDFEPVKATHQVEAGITAGDGLLAGCAGLPVRGYEIHMGRSHRLAGAAPSPFRLMSRSGSPAEDGDGAVDETGNVLGTYLHGFFDNTEPRVKLLANLARRKGMTFTPGLPLNRAAAYDRLAACLRAELDLERLRSVIGLEMPAWAV
jgi:adenosylcobyric acid synthase